MTEDKSTKAQKVLGWGMVAHAYITLIQQADTGLLNLREHPEEYGLT